jgi:hypothetical protein
MRYIPGPVIAFAIVSLTVVLPASAPAQHPGEIRRVKVEGDTTLGGIRCQATKRPIGFHPSGALESCSVAAETTISGHRFPTGTWLYLDNAGQLASAWLRRDTELQGHVCKGTGFGGWSVVFHGNGQLRLCYLAQQQTIQGIPCSKGSFWGEIRGSTSVSFHETGSLASCSAARPVVVDSVTFKSRQRVSLRPAGRS